MVRPTGRLLPRYVRRRRSRRRRRSKSRAKPTDAPLPQPSNSSLEASGSTSDTHPKKDRGITAPADAWPALPTKNVPAEPLLRPPKVTSERYSGDSHDEEVVAMVKALMNTLRVLLSSIHTPAARSALQILDALNPVLSSLENHHGSPSAALP